MLRFDRKQQNSIKQLSFNKKNNKKKYTCTPVFIVALFTIAKTWKQPKCPSTDEQIRKMWYIYTMECYLDRWNFSADCIELH